MMDKLFDFLTTHGYTVYLVNQKTDDCTSPYIVIKEDSTMAQFDTNKVGNTIVDIMFFTPRTQMLELLNLKKNVKIDLKGFTALKYSGIETPTVADDTVKAVTCSVQYLIQHPLI